MIPITSDIPWIAHYAEQIPVILFPIRLVWLHYQDYAENLKQPIPAAHSLSDLSTLFVARSIELYLRDGGSFAFVMPFGTLVQKTAHRIPGWQLGQPSITRAPGSLRRALDLSEIRNIFHDSAWCELQSDEGRRLHALGRHTVERAHQALSRSPTALQVDRCH